MREIAKYFEVGGHTVTHPPDIKLLDDEAIEFEVRMNKKWVENVIGREIEWFCYPRGRYNDRVIDIVKSVGYKYARTTITGKTTKLEKYDPYRVHTTVHVHPDKKEFKGLSFVEYTKKMFDKAKAENGDFHIWGHGWEIHKYRMWEQLEEVLAYAGTKP
jgi:peptidoglycan/xylan/chitin deacetylase (PgdA/CDA1 family)